MTEKVLCPHCKAESAWYEADYQDTWLRCLCGSQKLVSTTLEHMVIEHLDTEEAATLPRRGSKLFFCLATLIGFKEATTGEITDALNLRKPKRDWQSNSDVASQLTVLRYKALVRVGTERKGVLGGSTWLPTDVAMRYFRGSVVK